MDNKVDVKKIMEEIREDIKSKGYTADMLGFLDEYNFLAESRGDSHIFVRQEYDDALKSANETYVLHYYRELNSNAIISLIKRAIRKTNKFLLAPIVEEQTKFNAAVVRNLNQICMYLQEQKEREEQYKNQIERLKTQLEEFENRKDD